MENSKYTVVVSSCDNYEDLWPLFFEVLRAEWEELKNLPIVLNTESKRYSHKGLNIKTMHLFQEGEDVSWTRRLRETLKRINTEYVLLLLDDFFMRGRIRSEIIDKNVIWLDENPRISAFCYKETTASKNKRDGRFEGFERRPLMGKYKFNCQAALWRRSRLISYLGKDEDPWEWESYGNWRSYRHPFHQFYSAIPGEKHVFPYIYEIDGYAVGGLAIYRGKWYIPCVESIFEKHEIQIDYAERGIISEDELRVSMFGKQKKRREDATGLKRPLWRAWSILCKIKEMLCNIRYLEHFF